MRYNTAHGVLISHYKEEQSLLFYGEIKRYEDFVHAF